MAIFVGTAAWAKCARVPRDIATLLFCKYTRAFEQAAAPHVPSMKKKAGHRSWKLQDGRVKGTHVGDTMSAETRSRVMSRIKGKNTGPERRMAEAMLAAGLVFEQHALDLPGKPDFVFREHQVVVFVDGDYWHGWRFPLWKHKLSPEWKEKIEKTRQRDQRNFRKLRRMGWVVVRIWEHQTDGDKDDAVRRVCESIRSSSSRCDV